MAALFGRPIFFVAFALSVVWGVPLAEAACADPPRAGVDWTKCEKRRLNLTGQDLSNGRFGYTDFSRSDLKSVRFVKADLSEAEFSKARLEGADLSEARMIKTNADRANFRKARLVGVDMTKAEMARADFTGADFSGAVMVKVEFGRSILSDANMEGADLSRAEIARAIFKGARLAGSNFSGAYTYLTRFEGADLSEITGLEQHQLDVACGDDATVLPAGLVRPSNWPCSDD
ncbi:pentapeptide repeat-containing protein [Pelagibius sp.]|uniref:pentapeptide repeat-containing protein n=1 Tax=Pelagibius sp. TaxID=1931238 RepID=UPI0026118086|nr:pentapeptide repeat-containing protein [Pelagibius sp.]